MYSKHNGEKRKVNINIINICTNVTRNMMEPT